jgi:hypothetical protein
MHQKEHYEQDIEPLREKRIQTMFKLKEPHVSLHMYGFFLIFHSELLFF